MGILEDFASWFVYGILGMQEGKSLKIVRKKPYNFHGF